MPLPPSLTTVTIYDTLVYQAGDLAGTPVQGYITFSPSVSVNVPVDLMGVPRSTIFAYLDDTGFFSVDLIATDDSDGEPVDWTYTVTEHFNRGGGRGTFSTYVPASMAPSGFYGDLTPAVATSGVVSYATTAQLAAKVSKSGDTMTGPLILAGDPTVALEAATKQYVDAGGGGGGTPSNTVESETTYGIAPDAGAATDYSRGDHTHGTVATPTKSTVGLGNVDNTSDANKPISTATQTALDAKQPLDADLTTIAGLTATTDNFMQSKSSAWASRTPAQVATDLQSLLTIAQSQVTNLTTDLAAKQPLDADLTTIAGLTATTDNFMQSKSSAWASRTPAQVAADLQGLVTIAQSQVTNLVSDLAAKQPLDSDLTTIAGLTATTDNIIQSVGSAWASRTPAQVKTALSLNNVDNTSDANKPVSSATQTALNLKADLASPTFTGTVAAATAALTGRLSIAPDSLTDAATIATDASLGNHFRVTLGGNRTLGNPTNAVDGQKIMWELIQDGSGNRTITLDTKFQLGSDITAVTLSTALNKRDFLGVVYNSGADKFYVIAFVKGY